MLKPKIGDLVRLKPYLVKKVEDLNGYFTCYGGDSFGFDVVEEILPRPLAVGDRVKFVLGAPDCPSDAHGTIVAISGEMAWVRQDYEFDSKWSTFNRRYLVRVTEGA